MPSASALLFVIVTGVGVGVGSVLIGHIMPSPANVEAESTRVKTSDAKSCCSFFMVFLAKVKVQSQAERIVGAGFVPAHVFAEESRQALIAPQLSAYVARDWKLL
jgi:hypothetical protein